MVSDDTLVGGPGFGCTSLQINRKIQTKKIKIIRSDNEHILGLRVTFVGWLHVKNAVLLFVSFLAFTSELDSMNI